MLMCWLCYFKPFQGPHPVLCGATWCGQDQRGTFHSQDARQGVSPHFTWRRLWPIRYPGTPVRKIKFCIFLDALGIFKSLKLLYKENQLGLECFQNKTDGYKATFIDFILNPDLHILSGLLDNQHCPGKTRPKPLFHQCVAILCDFPKACVVMNNRLCQRRWNTMFVCCKQHVCWF